MKRIRIIALYTFLELILIFFMALSYHLAQPMLSSNVIFLPKGGVNEIITHLSRNHFQVTRVDGWVIRAMGYPQSGWIDIHANLLSRGDFLYRLTKAKAAMKEATLIPGETLHFFILDLAQNFSLSPLKLKEAYHRYAPHPEGVILADTYKIPLGISEEHLMYYLVNHSLREHQKLSKKILGVYDEVQWFKYITIASIIQKEAANIEEMPLVSAVIRNRLKKRMRLQMDGTLNYGEFSRTKVTPEMIRQDSSPYNTYKIEGIPPYPVGSVGFDAIKAAIFPADVDYLYFVRNKKGTHTFTNNYETHLKNIK